MNLPREAVMTVSNVSQYCAAYQDLFPEVRSYECFKFLHVGMISELKRKSLPVMPQGGLPVRARAHLLDWKIPNPYTIF